MNGKQKLLEENVRALRHWSLDRRDRERLAVSLTLTDGDAGLMYREETGRPLNTIAILDPSWLLALASKSSRPQRLIMLIVWILRLDHNCFLPDYDDWKAVKRMASSIGPQKGDAATFIPTLRGMVALYVATKKGKS